MVKCTVHGVFSYFSIGMFSLSLIVDIYAFLYDPEHVLSDRGELVTSIIWAICSIIGLIFILMLLRNFAVYIENDTIVHINWRKKKRVFHPEDIERIEIGIGRHSGNQTYIFSNGRCSINCNYRNYDTVSEQILELLKDYRNDQ